MKATEEQKRVLRMYLDSLKQGPVNGAVSHDDAAVEWHDPISLDPPAPPALFVNIFPTSLAAMIKAVASETETAIELSAASGLAVVSASVQGKFEVEVKTGYHEPLNLFLAAFADSGERKSAVQAAMTRPLVTFEADELVRTRAKIARERSDYETLKSHIKRLRDRLVARLPIDSPEFARANDQLRAEEIKLASKEIPRPPRVWTEDFTPEALGALMFEQGERMAAISDEPGLFSILAGRYSNGIPNLELVLKSFTGSPTRVDRAGRPPVVMEKPLLTISLSPQPSIIPSLRETKEFRGRGLLARFIFFLPSSMLGQRTGDTPSVPPEVAAAYERMVRALLDVPRRDQPAVLQLSDEARTEWKEFAKAVECDLRPGGRFENVKDWAARAPGLAARVAGVCHCVSCADAEVPPDARPVELDAMKKALEFTAVAIDHALVFFDAMGADAALDGARKVWRWIERERKPTFKFKDCFDALKGTYSRTEELEPAFEVLAEREHILLMPEEPHVGRPSRIYAVNPKLVATWEAR